MRLQTLGGLRLEPSDFHRPKPLLLLAYLAIEGAKDRRHLAELFWPEASEPATSLRVALGQLRKGAPQAISDDGRRLSLGVECDAPELLETIRDHRFERVPPLYAGAFLEGFWLPDWGAELEEWVYATREFIASQVRAGLVRLAESEANRGRLLEAARHATAAYQLRGARPPEPDEFERLHALLVAGDSPLAVDVRREAGEFGLELRITPAEARARLAPNAPDETSRSSPRATPNNLPSARTSFVGRDPELVEVGGLLERGAVRLVTLLGPGGIGKTRLALQIARDQLQEDRFTDGVYFVALESLNTPDQIPRAVADALGVSVQGNADPLEAVVGFVGTRAVLIVLDNFEHLVEGAELASKLLECCPNLTLLVTSRERLQLEEEFVLPLSGLPVPSRTSSLDDAELNDAVKLFVQRAKRTRIDFSMLEPDLPHVLEICGLLEGSPLGIELAAAWVKAMPPQEIARELTHGFDLLETTVRNAKEGHRSLRAVFEHSWALLTPREQDVFARLAVFQGGFTREAASEVTNATIPVLASLVDKSLLRVDQEGRFERHALVHQYALEKLEVRSEVLRTTRAHHAKFFLELAQAAAPELYGVSKALWLEKLGREHENFRAALEWARTHGQYELGLRLAGALKNYWMIRGHLHEGSGWLEHLLEREVVSTQRVPPDVRATALTGAAWLAHARDDFVRATTLFEESASLRRSLGETGGLEAALVNEAMLARSEGDYVRATSLLEQSLSRQREAKNRDSIGRDGLGLSLSRLALVLCEQGEYTRAETLYDESLALHRELSDRGGIAATLLGQSDIAREQGDAVRTRALAEESIKLFEELGEEWGIAFALNNLALAAYAQGDLERAYALGLESTARARTLWGGAPNAESLSSLALIDLARHDLERARDALQQSLTATRRYGPRWLVAVGLEGFAVIALREHQPARAARLLGASEALRERMGVPLSPLRRPMYERLVQETRDALGLEIWTSSFESGAATSLERVISFALTRDPRPETSSGAVPVPKEVG